MNLTYFQPRERRNVENNNCPLNIRFVAKTSDIRKFSQNITSGPLLATLLATTRLQTSQCSSKFFESTACMRAWDTMEQQLSSTIEK